MNKIISVISPVYNVENYLNEFLDSLVNQTYSNLQIILVDDGSTDQSGAICDEYARKDSRIQVIHQENAGAGVAKNVGLTLVSGEYFSIVDSDDFLELNYYEKMLDAMLEFDVDVVQCRFRYCYTNKRIDVSYNFSHKGNTPYTNNKYLIELLYDWKYAIFANKLFRSSLLRKDIRFPVGRKIDDEFFTYKLICNAKRIFNINDVLYNYRMRQSSVMNDSKEVNLMCDRIDCFKERYEYVTALFPKLKRFYYYNISNYILFCSRQYSDDRILSAKNEYPIKKENIFDKILRRIVLKDFNSEKAETKECELFE